VRPPPKQNLPTIISAIALLILLGLAVSLSVLNYGSGLLVLVLVVAGAAFADILFGQASIVDFRTSLRRGKPTWVWAGIGVLIWLAVHSFVVRRS
jgi:hypothetical protein